MSTDNTIGILVTAEREGSGCEYRVAHAQAIENIVAEPDYPEDSPTLNRQAVVDRFGDSRVFQSERDARTFARMMKAGIVDKGGVVEYGIKVLDYSNFFFPSHDV